MESSMMRPFVPGPALVCLLGFWGCGVADSPNDRSTVNYALTVYPYAFGQGDGRPGWTRPEETYPRTIENTESQLKEIPELLKGCRVTVTINPEWKQRLIQGYEARGPGGSVVLMGDEFVDISENHVLMYAWYTPNPHQKLISKGSGTNLYYTVVIEYEEGGLLQYDKRQGTTTEYTDFRDGSNTFQGYRNASAVTSRRIDNFYDVQLHTTLGSFITAAHEIGHQLGLSHTTDDIINGETIGGQLKPVQSLMYPDLTKAYDRITGAVDWTSDAPTPQYTECKRMQTYGSNQGLYDK
jgi:hypothetical protein